MENPKIGQRWLVDTDSTLGLGMLVECQARQIVLEFPAMGERRIYSRENAPLTRAVFDPGDLITTIDGEDYVVAKVDEVDGLLIYTDQTGHLIPESQLASSLSLNHPLKRLLSGQLDNPRWFYVRETLARGLQSWQRSGLQGLIGCRITLTPYQLYVAHSATSRSPVRVLLADEVGLGKTIEAGLILQRLQYQGSVRRTLILVPESLCVQWFVELMRCFSIPGVLVSEHTALEDSRVFIAPHSMITNASLLEADPWDLLIIDEAHHFDVAQTSPETECLRKLSHVSTHCLLLTATPERLGVWGHFSRLQLLDSDKFHDLKAFQKEYERYQALAEDLQTLLDDRQGAVNLRQKQVLEDHFDIQLPTSLSRSSLIELLLDSYGTGRMVYRNTRRSVSGFPKRRLVIHRFEARQQKLSWLSAFLKSHHREKILLIAHERCEILAVKKWLYDHTGMDCPVFHEAMTLVERDRAAAYFADAEVGAPLLLCSEIGSEGRNFQFCHRLICWDLPEHPDVLEQRIGRLDRIGQTRDVEINVCVGDAQSAKNLHWFHNILNCIEQVNPAAGSIHDQWHDRFLMAPEQVEPQVKRQLTRLLRDLEQGRDRLLEMNSCRQPEATQLAERIEQQMRDNHPQVLLEHLTDVLNLHYELVSETRFHLVPSDQMLVPIIPGIPSDGCEITFDRSTAIAREDVQFVTWDHPLMQGLAEMIGTSELGVASIALLVNKKLPPGTLFAEALFSLDVQSTASREARQYLSESSLRVVVAVDKNNDFSRAMPSEALLPMVTDASESIKKAVLREASGQITKLLECAQQLAEENIQDIRLASLNHLDEREDLEIARLRHLQSCNNEVSEVLIQRKAQEFAEVRSALQDGLKLSLSAVRLLISTPSESGR